MSNRNVHRTIVSILLACMLNACGGGGGSGEGASGVGTGSSGLAFPLNVVVANAKFLLFPNPQRQGLVGAQEINQLDQTNTQTYASAYYAAIDPLAERTTKAAWRIKNGFGSGTGSEVSVVFGDQDDLGYGRRMTARQSTDGSLAFFVDNYLVNLGGGGYSYSTLNVDAAVVQSSQRFVSTSAIEYSDLDGPGGVNGPKFVKFYVFDTSGNRKLVVDQDGLGEKAMPNICVSCHGGRADPLTTDAPARFPVVGNSISQQAGDTISKLQVLKVHTFDFSALTDPTTGTVRSRASQEANMKTINQWVRDTFPNNVPADNEWDGSIARAFIEKAYGGAGFPSASYIDADAKSFLPDGIAGTWAIQGQGLYQNVVGPVCMTCHILRGTRNQSDIAFTTFTQFNAYADRIKAHVYDRGNMPLVKLGFDDFWASTSVMPQLLAAVPSIATQGATATLKPGRPIADPGPDRFVKQGVLNLSAVNSLYASSFNWSIVSNPGGASFTGGTSGSATSVNFPADGMYVIRLTASGNGLVGSKDITVLVDNTNAPTTPNFTAIQSALTSCQAGCHEAPLTDPVSPPLSYDPADYATALEFYNTVKGRINFSDVVASQLLRKPSNNHHNGGLQAGFDTSRPLGDNGRAKYDLFVEWIMAGAPQ